MATLAAALKTVSIEKTALRAVPKLPVATKVVANLDIIVAQAALVALTAIAEVIVKDLINIGARRFPPAQAAAKDTIIITPGPIDSCSHEVYQLLGILISYWYLALIMGLTFPH